MTIDSETQINPTQLEKLAISSGDRFLSAMEERDRRLGRRDRDINLTGASPEMLGLLKEQITDYLAEKGEVVNVQINGTTGYPINVGFLLANRNCY
ncbi:MAG: hypothetical protein NTW17_02005 [Candidatus Pacearchaeota archaeon]|nr:hypothetical protein [Candidatus Pacearchaeota archaeon]